MAHGRDACLGRLAHGAACARRRRGARARSRAHTGDVRPSEGHLDEPLPGLRAAALVAGEPKTPFFGGGPKLVWLCPRCQAEFVQKAAPAGGGAATYELKRAGAAGAAVAKGVAKVPTARWEVAL